MTQGSLPPLLLVGYGKMGSAMAQGWLEQGVEQLAVIRPRPSSTAPAAGVTVYTHGDLIPDDFKPKAVVLAVKPQQADAALPAIARFLSPEVVIISVMAGKTTAGIGALLGSHARVVRAMPNTPASIRRGFTCAYAAPGVAAHQRRLADALLSAVGEVAWVEDEKLIDPATAISGGGPAYVFLLAELLEKAAVDQGLPPELARRMARGTVSGAGALLAASEVEPGQLRRDVTSPKGTTEQALKVLMAPDAWPRHMAEAIEAATARSRELAE